MTRLLAMCFLIASALCLICFLFVFELISLLAMLVSLFISLYLHGTTQTPIEASQHYNGDETESQLWQLPFNSVINSIKWLLERIG